MRYGLGFIHCVLWVECGSICMEPFEAREHAEAFMASLRAECQTPWCVSKVIRTEAFVR